MPGMRTKVAVGTIVPLLLIALGTTLQAAQISPTDPPRITVEEVKEMLDQGEEVLFIDVRSRGQWASSGHKAQGAIRVENTSDLQKLIKTYPPNTPIVTYCT